MKKPTYKITIYTSDGDDYIRQKDFYTKSQYLANKIINDYASRDETIDIESEVIKWNFSKYGKKIL